MSGPPAPLILHVVYRFAVGGLENGVVNLINRLPVRSWRHAVLSLTDVDEEFASRIVRDDVRRIALRKRPGHAWRHYPAITSLMRELGPLSSLAPAFPWASQSLAPLRSVAEARGLDDFSPLWSGTSPGAFPGLDAPGVTRRLAGMDRTGA